MNELQKLRVLISHWIDHNEEHADEFRRCIAFPHYLIPVLALAKLAGPLDYHRSH